MAKSHATIAQVIDGLTECRMLARGARPDVLVGLVGRGIQLSRSPAMHEREAERMGLTCAYVLIDFDKLELADTDLPAVIDAVETCDFDGINVTYPFKQSVMPLLNEITDDATAIGAVNTVVFAKSRTGHNTDSWGYAESFRTSMTGAALGHVVLFGAGGAGSAVGYALIGLGVKAISIIDADNSRAQALAARLSGGGAVVVAVSDIPAALTAADGIVNTTPVGMASHPGTPFDTSLLRPSQWVSEVIYFPQKTELLRQAAAVGCLTLPGIGMAIGQAARAFELFTGRAADMKTMADHFGEAA